MANISNRMTKYEAPEGYVYDWATPKENGERLLVKYLFLSKKDTINNYILVKDPKGE